MRVIALLTDFGTGDVFAGSMKGVIATLAPRVTVLDLTHEIPPGDVAAAALRLWQSAPHMPAGTIFLAVVDPGVGSARRAVALSTPRFLCVGPDNGIFTYLLAGETPRQIVEISPPAGSRVSATFHGRDVFAPAAARLAAGLPLRRLGPTATGLVALPLPTLEAGEGLPVRGEVLAVDRFGNVITSIGRLAQGRDFLDLEPWLPGRSPVRLEGTSFLAELPGGRTVPLRPAFSDAAPGRPLAYIGSDGLLEIGVNRGRACDLLGLAPGAEVGLAAGPAPS